MKLERAIGRKWFRSQVAKVLFSVPLFFALAGCSSFLYLSNLGWHQGQIAYYSSPIEEVLARGEVDEQVKDKIRLIQAVKQYGEEHLGLRPTKSYTTYYELKGPILNVVTACEKDRLELRTWRFPVVGEVTYKGFFTEEGAERERERLEEEGLDTFVQPVGAYSTLGWMRDPIFSSMLRWSPATLANVILQEMTHGTVYFKGATNLNERIATFVGNKGAIRFTLETYGPESKEYLQAVSVQEDDLLFSLWVERACDKLSFLYGRDIPREEKIRERQEILQLMKGEFLDLRGKFKTKAYADLETMEINNAVLLAHRRYLRRLDALEGLYEDGGQDLRKVVAFLKEAQVSKEKRLALTSLASPE